MVRFDADVFGDSTLKDPPSIRPRMGHLPRLVAAEVGQENWVLTRRQSGGD
jgi:hypothetical protein